MAEEWDAKTGNKISQFDISEELFMVKVTEHWNRCPARLWSLHPWEIQNTGQGANQPDLILKQALGFFFLNQGGALYDPTTLSSAIL